MKKIGLLIILYFPLLSTTAFGQQGFSYTENTKINEKVDSVLSLYNIYAGLTETGSFIYPPYIKKFKNLFIKEAKVYNDIEPDSIARENNSLLTINEYVDSIQRWYKKGLTVGIKDIKKGKITQISSNKYTKIVKVKKELFATHKTKGYYDKNFKLIFTISFTKQGKLFENFKIEKINSEIIQLPPTPPENINIIAGNKQVII